MGNKAGGTTATLKNVMKEFLQEDEDMVKNLKKKDKEITFFFDVIDEDIPVKIRILESNQYEYSYKNTITKANVKETVSDPSFEDFLKLLLDDLYSIRNKKIDYYNSLETPSSATTTSTTSPFPGEEEENEGESDEDEEIYLTVSTPSMVNSAIQDEFEDEIRRRVKKKKQSLEPLFKTLTPEELIQTQKLYIDKVSLKTGISKASCMVLLRSYRWNDKKLYLSLENKGKEEILREVGLSLGDKNSSSEKKEEEVIIEPNDEFECPSCYDDVKFKETMLLDSCNHRFCNDCWKEHLTIKIKDGLSKRILCMGSDCPCVVDENIVSSYITDPEMKKKYDTKLLESFVEDNDLMRWCQSAPHCGNAALINIISQPPALQTSRDIVSTIPFEIHCKCRKIFCFSCLDEAHQPCTCKMLQEWRKKCADDSETLNWIKSNTRDCPKCGKATIKNGGCNHISCVCGAHWCWACGGDFNTQTVYSHQCNRYLEQDEGNDINDTRQSLARYLHYFNHYNVHRTSIRNQIKMQLRTNQKVRRIFRQKRKRKQKLSTSSAIFSDPYSSITNPEEDLKFLKDGLNVLFDTRRVLMHSYVFAYFLFDKSASGRLASASEEHRRTLMRGFRDFSSREDEEERVRAKNFFEDTQEQLELTTEALNQLLDLPLEEMLKVDKRREIEHTTFLNEKRVHNLFQILREGTMMVREMRYMLPKPRYLVTAPDEEREKLSTLFGFRQPTEKTNMNDDEIGSEKKREEQPQVTHNPNGFLAVLKDLINRASPVGYNIRDNPSSSDDDELDGSEEEDDW